MTERMASGWMTVWRLDTGELKRSGKTQSRWWETGTAWNDAEEAIKSGVERTRETKGNGEENIISFRSDP